MFDRSAEVDEAIHESLAEHFRTTNTAASEEENELIDEVLGYEKQVSIERASDEGRRGGGRVKKKRSYTSER
jgi:hypothetical protein